MKIGHFWGKVLIAVFFLTARPGRAVIFYSTGDPQYNTTAPGGALAGSGWDLQGDSFPGIPIAPNFFVTATHVGGKVDDIFSFRGIAYRMVASFVHPDADLTIWQVDKPFPAYAPLYTSSDEVGRPLVVFGRGAERGGEIRLNGVLKGWAWGKSDGILRWGENVVAGISDPEGHPATPETTFQLLRADFEAGGRPNEAHLSGGDSGGGVFIHDGESWKLAGVNHAANKDYSYVAMGPGFNGTLFDESGLFEGEDGQREYHAESGGNPPQPGSFYATRISACLGWIQNIIASPQSNTEIVLEETDSILGSYTPVAGASVNPEQRTITIPRPLGTRFYRVLSDTSRVIQSLTNSGDQVVLTYE